MTFIQGSKSFEKKFANDSVTKKYGKIKANILPQKQRYKKALY